MQTFETFFSESDVPVKTLFASIVLTPDSQKLLIDKLSPIHSGKVYAHHVTLCFIKGPTPEQIAQFTELEGQEATVVVTGWASDSKAQAALVEITLPCLNTYPHITISTAVGTSPVYSNALFDNAPLHKIHPFVLHGVVEVEKYT